MHHTVAVLVLFFNRPLMAEELFMAESSRSDKRSIHQLVGVWNSFGQRHGGPAAF